MRGRWAEAQMRRRAHHRCNAGRTGGGAGSSRCNISISSVGGSSSGGVGGSFGGLQTLPSDCPPAWRCAVNCTFPLNAQPPLPCGCHQL